ncbi:MAG: nicotinate phosphoribosyltransferase [Bacillota bacterium]
MKHITSLDQIKEVKMAEDRLVHSGTHEEILSGLTTDVYFLRTMDILRHMELDNVEVTAEIFARKPGCLAGIEEVKNMLRDKNVQVWAIEEGESFEAKETLVRIKGPYREFAVFETAMLGSLASASGWATAAKEVKDACGDKTFLCFGARHVHPAVAPVMERAAIIGGASGVSCVLASKIIGMEASGTLPHAAMLIAGDTLEVALAYDRLMPDNHKRIVLVDTYKDEVEESLRIAEALGDKLYGVRLDTPSERGGVTPHLVRELRCKLDVHGYQHVKIFVSGGLTPDKIKILSEAGADAFGVGSFISGAPAIDMTMDIKEVEKKPVAKRGRIPGIVENKKLKRIL